VNEIGQWSVNHFNSSVSCISLGKISYTLASPAISKKVIATTSLLTRLATVSGTSRQYHKEKLPNNSWRRLPMVTMIIYGPTYV